MNYTEMRRLLLKVFIGFLSLTALVAIFSVLNTEFGQTQLKVLLTTFSISAGSICAMSCAGFIERGGTKAAGIAGILAASLAVVLVMVGVWGEVKESDYWKATVTSIVVSAAFAHGCLLRLPNLGASYGWTQTVSAFLIGLLALQIILAVLGEIKGEGYYRLMAALSVLVVLITLVIPICSRLDAKADQAPADRGQAPECLDHFPDRVLLRRVSGALYADQAGRCFKLTEIEPEPGAALSGGPSTPAKHSGVKGGPRSEC